jgi:hypothetical protein
VTAYNGAETKYPRTIARLEAIFGVPAVTAVDTKMRADVVVVQGKGTPVLEPPVTP